MLEAEWRQFLRGSVGMEIKEDESSTGHVWAAGFHRFTVCTTTFKKLHVYIPLTFCTQLISFKSVVGNKIKPKNVTNATVTLHHPVPQGTAAHISQTCVIKPT
jgi:hypothetical protein